jgi:DNA-binding transcriptional regulator YhcF (GntR family)
MDPITEQIINRARRFQAVVLDTDDAEASEDFREMVADQLDAIIREAERLALR